MWAHAEYIKLLRSVNDGKVFDFAPDAAKRYLSTERKHEPLEIWKHNRQPRSMKAGWKLRIQAPSPFRLTWTNNGWRSVNESAAAGTDLGIDFFDIQTFGDQKTPIQLTFFRTDEERWEGKDYQVEIQPA